MQWPVFVDRVPACFSLSHLCCSSFLCKQSSSCSCMHIVTAVQSAWQALSTWKRQQRDHPSHENSYHNGVDIFQLQLNVCIAKIRQCSDLIAACRWYTLTQLDGSLAQLAGFASEAGLRGTVAQWPTPSAQVWQLLVTVGGVQAALQYFVPGKKFLGPVSPKGNVPVYKVLYLLLDFIFTGC